MFEYDPPNHVYSGLAFLYACTFRWSCFALVFLSQLGKFTNLRATLVLGGDRSVACWFPSSINLPLLYLPPPFSFTPPPLLSSSSSSSSSFTLPPPSSFSSFLPLLLPPPLLLHPPPPPTSSFLSPTLPSPHHSSSNTEWKTSSQHFMKTLTCKSLSNMKVPSHCY